MNDVVASREYVLEKGTQKVQLVLDLGTPAKRPDNTGAWYCPFVIRQGDKARELSADGVDALHALTLALSAADTILRSRSVGGPLRMMDGTEGTGLAWPNA